MLNIKNQAGKSEKSAGRRDALNLPPLDVNRRYDIPTACAYLGISRVRLYAKLKAAEIRPLKDGGRTFIPGSEIVRLSTIADLALHC